MTQREALASGVILSSDYEIERVLGAGGFGITYLARDMQLGLKVAIKEYFPASLAVRSEGATVEAVAQQSDLDFDWGLDRFLLEARTLALMSHPNIARLLDGGRNDDGVPFLVLEYVDGEPIDVWCDRHGLDTRARLKLMMKVCRAVEYAHRNLVVHRDLKPTNILVNAQGQREVDGRPEVIVQNCEESLTRLGIEAVDFYYLHRRDKRIPIEDSVGALADLVRAGKAKTIGLSEVSAATIRAWVKVPTLRVLLIFSGGNRRTTPSISGASA